MTSEIIPFAHLSDSDLCSGHTYLGGNSGHVGDDPIQHLLPVGNQGGIRIAGSVDECRIVALYSTLEHPDWPDAIDPTSGTVTYHGDNRSAGPLLGPTGNRVLHRVFERGFATPASRAATPAFFVFTKAAVRRLPSRSVVFRGVAVPGAPAVAPQDWLLAKWFDRPSGRFENYVVTLTLLELPVITRDRLGDLQTGEALGSASGDAFSRWIERGHGSIT